MKRNCIYIESVALNAEGVHPAMTIKKCRGGSRTAPIGYHIHMGGSRTAPTAFPSRKPIGRLIGAFKTVSTKRVNESRKTPGAQLWQRNYYEHVIRNDDELNSIRQYIMENPIRWDTDRENPEAVQRAVKIKKKFEELAV